MGTKELRKRKNWQKRSGIKAGRAEKTFFEVFSQEFENSGFTIRKKPKEFSNIYFGVNLSKETLTEIYTPEVKEWRHGVMPDYAIGNTKTQKTLYVEVKRQDGWVERKQRSAGRGNAHERSCKFFTPGLLKVLREHGKIGNDVLPFWVVFQGDITRDPCRVREITLWYDEHSSHFFMWRNSADSKYLIEHFNKKLKHLLT